VRTRAALAEEVEPAPAGDQHPDTNGLVSVRQAALAGNTSRRSATLAAAADTLEILDLSRAVSPETLGPSRSAYVRITRGCNKFCTYCVVPFTRGAEVHRPPQHIVDECRRLADAGVVEVTLLGQTVNHYRFEHGAAVSVNGVVQPQKGRVYKRGGSQTDAYAGANVTTFADLLAMIHERVPAVRRLRFVTSYPRDFGDDVLRVMRGSPRVCRYLHVPAQSGSDRVLGLMNRGYSVAEYLEFLDRARALLHQPEIGRPLTLAGDIIVGFPTETEADFEATRVLLERARYKNCFIFKYSPRPGTVAIDRFADDVPDEVKRRRNNELLGVQNRISGEVGREFVGQTLDVFVQGVSRKTAKARARAEKRHAHGGVGLTIGGRAVGGEPDDLQEACSTGAPQVEVETAAPPTAGGPVQMTARTDGDLIVLFDTPGGVAPDGLIGTIQRVRIDASRPLALHGALVRG
ncbi:MAG: radical SAM protein, partial [Phycisphaerales bacterium]|nr:radical SAM protein [Phycisphaerales bacterium]